MRGLAVLLAATLLVASCGSLGPLKEEADQACEANNVEYECRLMHAYALHGTASAQITHNVGAGLMAPELGRELLGDKDVCTSVAMLGQSKCNNLAGAWWALEEANSLGDTVNGDLNLNTASQLIAVAQRILIELKQGGG
jgi:hypothetical protein